MFCGKCGNEVLRAAKFCPGCGAKIEIQKLPVNLGNSLENKNINKQTPKITRNYVASVKDMPRNVWLIGGIIALIVIIIGFLLIVGGKKEKEKQEDYSAVGVWKIDGMLDMGEVVSGVISEKTGLDSYTIEQVLDMMGIGVIENVTFTFADSGQIFIGAEDIGGIVGDLRYSDAGNGKMVLSYAVSIPIIGQNVAATYTSDYEVGKNNMILDFFGTKLRLIREDDEEEMI